MARAVNACSPPDNSDKDCSRLPGGLARISRPASSGSSASVSCNSAVPPPNNLLNSVLKCWFTSVKLFSRRSRPSRFNCEIAARNLAMAASKSSRSVSIVVMRLATSSISASARRLTGPILSRSRISLCTRSSSTSICGRVAGSSISAMLATASGAQFSFSKIRAFRSASLAVHRS